MNKISFSIIFILGISASVFSQTFGIRAGLNYSTFRGDKLPEETFGYSGGFHFGLTYALHITDLFSLRAELIYAQLGTEYLYKGESYYIVRQSDKVTYERGILDYYDLKISNAYMSIPIVADFKVSKKWNIFAGPYVNILVGATGRGELQFRSTEHPDEFYFNQSLDFNYNSDRPKEISGTFVNGLDNIGILIDGKEVTLPRFAGAYTLQGKKTANRFNPLDVGITAGFQYAFNKGIFVGAQVDYGFLDLTNNKADLSLKYLKDDFNLVFEDDKDTHFGIHLSFGFRF